MMKRLTLIWILFALLLPEWEALAARPPETGGEIRVLSADGFYSLDPALASTEAERLAAGLVAEPLFQADGVRTHGLLALRSQLDDDGMALRVWLKPELRFHNGSSLRTADVRASFERVLKAARFSAGAKTLKNVKGAAEFMTGKAERLQGFEDVSPFEFVLRFNRAMADVERDLADPALGIVPERAARRGALGFAYSGTGPFKIKSAHAQRVELAANEAYREGRPIVDKVVFVTAGMEAEKQALIKGEVELALPGRVTPPKGTVRLDSEAGLSTLFVRNPESALPALDLVRTAFDCGKAVRFFERRLNAQSKALKETAENEICPEFKQNLVKARELAAHWYRKTFLVRVASGRSELRSIAERLVLHLEAVGVTAKVVIMDGEAERGGAWELELMSRPEDQGSEDGVETFPSANEAYLYFLPFSALLREAGLSTLHFNAHGLLDLASAYRRDP